MKNITWPEIIVLGLTFVFVLGWVWTSFIVDLPDDFLDKRKD